MAPDRDRSGATGGDDGGETAEATARSNAFAAEQLLAKSGAATQPLGTAGLDPLQGKLTPPELMINDNPETFRSPRAAKFLHVRPHRATFHASCRHVHRSPTTTSNRNSMRGCARMRRCSEERKLERSCRRYTRHCSPARRADASPSALNHPRIPSRAPRRSRLRGPLSAAPPSGPARGYPLRPPVRGRATSLRRRPRPQHPAHPRGRGRRADHDRAQRHPLSAARTLPGSAERCGPAPLGGRRRPGHAHAVTGPDRESFSEAHFYAFRLDFEAPEPPRCRSRGPIVPMNPKAGLRGQAGETIG